MSTTNEEVGTLETVEIGPVETGIPLPRMGGFLARLRNTLEQLEVGGSVQLLNVVLKQEKYIRSTLPAIGRTLDAKFSVRVVDNKRDRGVRRTLRVHRVG